MPTILLGYSAPQSSAQQKTYMLHRLTLKKSTGGTTGLLYSEITCSTSQLYAYCMQQYALCKGSCSTYYK